MLISMVGGWLSSDKLLTLTGVCVLLFRGSFALLASLVSQQFIYTRADRILYLAYP